MEFPKSHDLATVVRYADCIKQLFQTSRRRLGPITLNSLLGFYDSGITDQNHKKYEEIDEEDFVSSFAGIKDFVNVTVPSYSSVEFKKHFRMTRECCQV